MCFTNMNMYKRRALEAQVGSIPEAAPLEVSEGDSNLSEPLKRKNVMFDSDDEDEEEVEPVIDSYEVSTFYSWYMYCNFNQSSYIDTAR